ncbi:MAG: hypothetical protein N2745_08425 [Syntrophorhabdaceae bacterium]|nr:hypothetical protein [Syntrophorhabdaceae bacterium]
MTFKEALEIELEAIRVMLEQKNIRYGNSAMNPLRIFSSADPEEAINVRIDDKLSRIKNTGEAGNDEDTLLDLIGYLVLKRIVRRLRGKDA